MVLDPGVFEPDTDTPFQKIRIRIHAFKEAGSDLPEDTDPDPSFFSTGSGSDQNTRVRNPGSDRIQILPFFKIRIGIRIRPKHADPDPDCFLIDCPKVAKPRLVTLCNG